MSRRNEVVVVIGRKGGGKSTLARRLVATRAHTIALDPMREYPGAVAHSYDHALAYLSRVRQGPFCRLALQTLSTDDELALLALAVHGDPTQALLPGYTIVVDEADRLCTPHSIPAPIHRAVNYGRHFNLSLVFVSRRPRRLHRDITANADVIYVGATQEPSDVDYLAEFMGGDAAERARAIQEPGHFLKWEAGGELVEIFPDGNERELPSELAGAGGDHG